MDGEAFVTTDVIVCARVLVVGVAHDDRPGYELERFTPDPVPEAALSNVGDREACVALDERFVGRAGAAAVVDHGDRAALQERGREHRTGPSGWSRIGQALSGLKPRWWPFVKSP
jgi:hypothetical protein